MASYLNKDEKVIIKKYLKDNYGTELLVFVKNPKLSEKKLKRFLEYSDSKTFDEFTDNGGNISNIWNNLKDNLLQINTDDAVINSITENASKRYQQHLKEAKARAQRALKEKAEKKLEIYKDEQKAKESIRAARKLAVQIEKDTRRSKKNMTKTLKVLVKIHEKKIAAAAKASKKKTQKKKVH